MESIYDCLIYEMLYIRKVSPSLNVQSDSLNQGKVIYIIFFTAPGMQVMLSMYLNSSTCIYLSLDNGVTMTSKRRENKNLVSFMFFFPCCNFFDGVWKFL